MVRAVPPFPLVRECLERLSPQADVLVVSATPHEALLREWEEHDLAKYTVAICGQEIGTKQESLEAAAKYPPDHTLMIGDAPGDHKAAVANHALFFPINPGGRGELAAFSRRGHRPFPWPARSPASIRPSYWPSSTVICRRSPPWAVDEG